MEDTWSTPARATSNTCSTRVPDLHRRDGRLLLPHGLHARVRRGRRRRRPAGRRIGWPRPRWPRQRGGRAPRERRHARRGGAGCRGRTCTSTPPGSPSRGGRRAVVVQRRWATATSWASCSRSPSLIDGLGSDAVHRPGPVVPALQSYWIRIHVTGAMVASSIFMVGSRPPPCTWSRTPPSGGSPSAAARRFGARPSGASVAAVDGQPEDRLDVEADPDAERYASPLPARGPVAGAVPDRAVRGRVRLRARRVAGAARGAARRVGGGAARDRDLVRRARTCRRPRARQPRLPHDRVRVPDLDVRGPRRGDLGRGGLGSLLGLGPQGDRVVLHLGALRRLPPRPLDPRLAGRARPGSASCRSSP
jgi:hypothetical protein